MKIFPEETQIGKIKRGFSWSGVNKNSFQDLLCIQLEIHKKRRAVDILVYKKCNAL